MTRSLLVGFLILAVAGCSRSRESTLADSRELVVEELSWLKREPSGKAAVIFEERSSRKFVQFGGNSLSVDLPHQTLSAEEMERADRVLERFGVRKQTYPLGAGQQRYMQTAFQRDLKGDEAEAFRITEAVFREIYRFPPDAVIHATRIE